MGGVWNVRAGLAGWRMIAVDKKCSGSRRLSETNVGCVRECLLDGGMWSRSHKQLVFVDDGRPGEVGTWRRESESKRRSKLKHSARCRQLRLNRASPPTLNLI